MPHGVRLSGARTENRSLTLGQARLQHQLRWDTKPRLPPASVSPATPENGGNPQDSEQPLPRWPCRPSTEEGRTHDPPRPGPRVRLQARAALVQVQRQDPGEPVAIPPRGHLSPPATLLGSAAAPARPASPGSPSGHRALGLGPAGPGGPKEGLFQRTFWTWG